MKGWIALLLTAALLCQLEPVHAVLHQNLPWLPETPPIELPRFYLTREDAVRSREENDGNSGPEEDQPVMGRALSGGRMGPAAGQCGPSH